MGQQKDQQSILVSLSVCLCCYSPANMGLLDPQTSDGRVIFFLPWQHATIAGTKSLYSLNYAH